MKTPSAPLASCCIDELTNIVSFLPQHQIDFLCHDNAGLRERFADLSQEEFFSLSLAQPAAEVIVHALMTGLGQMVSDQRDRFVRLVVVGLLHQPLAPRNDVYLDMDQLQRYLSTRNGEPSRNTLHFVTQFSSIERLHVVGAHNPNLAFLIQCLPKLKSVVLPQYCPHFSNSGAPCNQVFRHDLRIANQAGQIKIGWLRNDSPVSVPSILTASGVSLSDIAAYYLPNETTLTLAQLIDGYDFEQAYTNQNRMLHLVNLCCSFHFNADVWMSLATRFTLRSVYRAIIAKIVSGHTLHHCRYKSGAPVIAEKDFIKLLKLDSGMELLLQLANDGIRFELACYPHLVPRFSYRQCLLLWQNGIPCCEFDDLNSHDVYQGHTDHDTLGRLENHCIHYTLLHIDNEKMIERVASRSWRMQDTLLTSTLAPYRKQIAASLVTHPDPWTLILRQMYTAYCCSPGRLNAILDSLKEIQPKAISLLAPFYSHQK